MGLVGKTQITDNLAVIVGNNTIDVLKTEGFPFDIQIRFVKVDEKRLDTEEKEAVFEPEYQLAYAAVYTNDIMAIKDIEDVKAFVNQLKEIKKLFEFAKQNKQNWFDTALFEGVLSEKVGTL
ncbi:hypothetical protein DDV21_010355 [Streptococcus chenjunshii]|uniref:Uncharacterized protein n=1 Tax=Streptococcus chenjunshii TaxID=2173853 RepID=A0A372KLQ4_9STRE|nr:hypothetical protein [Streptococcus chenjunshii]AXQ79447.1 hypothetical protein DDV21_010355 [Streptococcus chenjunshii]RFU51095.1 hypothetical protein DDV22_05145 [Streptococcus chenjunshii]RFU53193.1 hypothetical protein DDV23_05655 [Streptococcus chenjunshii]